MTTRRKTTYEAQIETAREAAARKIEEYHHPVKLGTCSERGMDDSLFFEVLANAPHDTGLTCGMVEVRFDRPLGQPGAKVVFVRD